MANLSENPQWVDGIYQIETSDPVVGGPDGVSNRQAKELASRTRYLKKEQEKTGSDLATHAAAADPHTQYAPKANPTFTGIPKAPTPATDSNSQQVATTAFVKSVAATKLAKDQNGADIQDKTTFYSNVLQRGALENGMTFASCNKAGDYFVVISDPNTISDMPEYKGQKLYGYGVLHVSQRDHFVGQEYTSHNGDYAWRQKWNDGVYAPWVVALSSSRVPTAADVGAYTKAETDARVATATTAASNAAMAAANANNNANGRVPSARKVNGKELTTDIALSAGDVGTYTKAETDARVATATTAANNAATAATNANTNANGRVPLGRKVNGKALTADIALTAADVGALPAAGIAVAATKLATPRKINGVAFDGTADINLNFGLKLKALGQYSPMNAIGVEFTAVNTNTLRCYITRQDQGYYVELGVTKMVLLDATLTDVISAPYVRRRLAGSFPVTKITMDNGLNASNGLWEINYPNHGVAVGAKKSFYIMGLVYREVGMHAIGQVADIDGLYYQMNVELDTPVSNPRVPIIAYAESELSSYFAIPIQVYGRKNFVNQRFGSIAHADFLDNSHISVCASDNNTDGIIISSMVTVMVYDL
ncbi:hypothetical protein [Pectobacterium colocasium]|uniref:hypothetical protein n=1 Tax=Pectobacterium colocasium TaxID=2878098 RepID=UPI003B287A3F